MSSCPERTRWRAGLAALLALAALFALPAAAADYAGIGRAATPKEIAAWDIDVRPDFKGLPKGSGSVTQGMEIWEGKCASCHGIFGESNEVFSPLVGGTTREDIKTGRVARLTDACSDCVVTFLCDTSEEEPVVVQESEAHVLRLLQDGGMVPQLRHRAAS